MKKIFILLAAMTLSFSSCGTDDNEIIEEVQKPTDDKNDNDEDKNAIEFSKVEVMFNANIAAIAYMADETKTILSIQQESENVHKITLSNRQEYFVYTEPFSGLIAPKLKIDETSGYWVLEGIKTTHKAKAEIGSKIVFPKFRLKEAKDNRYWEVSYDNGKNFSTVWNKDSQKVSVQRDSETEIQANPISSFSNNTTSCSVTLTTGETFERPVLSGLICQITNKPEDDSAIAVDVNTGKEIAYFIQGEKAEFELPERWKIMNNNTNLTIVQDQPTEANAKIKSRQNDKDKRIILKVTLGETTVYDWVEAYATGEVSKNYSKYQNGETIQIGDISINKNDGYGDGIYVDADREVRDRGVYFIEPGVTIRYTGEGARLDHIIFINTSNNPEDKCHVRIEKQIILDKGGHKFYCKNVKFSGIHNPIKSYKGYFNIAFDLCDITFDGSIFSYQREERGLDSFYITNSTIHFGQSKAKTLISNECWNNVWFPQLVFKNNIFYCQDGNTFKNFNILSTNRGVLKRIIMENNLFVNIEPGENLISANSHEADQNYKPWFSIKNNLFWSNDTSDDGQKNIFSINERSNTNPIEGSCRNTLYWSASNRTWKAFKQDGHINLSDFAELQKCDDDPFETVDCANAIFKLKPEYSQYGPQ